jgi:hypothetical protein
MANNDSSKRKREDKDGETKLVDVVNELRDRLDQQEVRARAQEDRFRKQEAELQNLKQQLRQREVSQQRLGKRVADLEEQVEEKEEELEKTYEELNKLKRKVTPLPLWKILTDAQYRDIFETCIVPKLTELEFRVFREVNRESRDAIRRSGRELKDTFEASVWYKVTRTYEKAIMNLEGKFGQYLSCYEAAVTGNLALLRWLREEKMFEWNEMTINAAVFHGYLHIVKYCMKQKCPFYGCVCKCAAENGHLDILKYLHENGAPWDSKTCRYAAKNNHIECLNYAKENGCPQDDTSSSLSESEESD